MSDNNTLPLSLLRLPKEDDRPALWAYITEDSIGFYDPEQNVWQGGFLKQYVDYDESWFNMGEGIPSIDMFAMFGQGPKIKGVAKSDEYTYVLKVEEIGTILDWFYYGLETDGQATIHEVSLMPHEDYDKRDGVDFVEDDE